jgi:hypothetical protein
MDSNSRTPAGGQVLVVVATGDPVHLVATNSAPPAQPGRRVEVAVGRPVAGIGRQYMSNLLAQRAGRPVSNRRAPLAATAGTRASSANANSGAAIATVVTGSPSGSGTRAVLGGQRARPAVTESVLSAGVSNDHP